MRDTRDLRHLDDQELEAEVARLERLCASLRFDRAGVTPRDATRYLDALDSGRRELERRRA